MALNAHGLNAAASGARLLGKQHPDAAWNRIVPASLLLHALLLSGIAVLPPASVTPPPPVRSIDVEMISEAGYLAATQPVPIAPDPAETVSAPASPPVDPPPADEATPGGDEGAMVQASRLYSAGILKDPANREVRDTLPKLSTYERITQLCNIEALEQIRIVKPEPLPDSMVAPAFADTSLQGNTLSATGAAYRSGRQWYRAQFDCTVAAGLESVLAFEFRIGELIPASEWDSHGLNAEDEDE